MNIHTKSLTRALKPIGLILLWLLSASGSLADDKIRLYTENFPPYNMSANGNPYEHKEDGITGYSTEIVQLLFERARLPYNLKLREWSYAYDRALKKENHAVFSTTRTESREPLFKWVGPIAGNSWTIYARADSNRPINSLEDLRPFRIGSYRGSAVAVYLKGQGLTVSELADDHLNPRRLAEGQIDFWASGNLTGLYHAKKQGYPDIKPVYTLRVVELYIALNKSFPQDTVDRLNSELEAMRADGSIETILKRYR